jgi:hypothetical protein
MSSLFDGLMNEIGRPLLEEYFDDADGIDYFDAGGTPAGRYDAAIGRERSEEVMVGDGMTRAWRQVRSVNFPKQDGLPFWNSEQAVGTFEFAGVAYAFEAVESLGETFAVVRLVRIGISEHAREGYRRK